MFRSRNSPVPQPGPIQRVGMPRFQVTDVPRHISPGVPTRISPDSMPGGRTRISPGVHTSISPGVPTRVPKPVHRRVSPYLGQENYIVAPKNNFSKYLRNFAVLLVVLAGLVVGGIFVYNNLINNNSKSVEEKKFKFCTHLVYLHCLSRNKRLNFPQRIDTIKKDFNDEFTDFNASNSDIERALKICKRPSTPGAYESCSEEIVNCSGDSHGESQNPSNEVGYHQFEAELKHIDGAYNNKYACIYPEVDTGENFGKEKAEFGTRKDVFEEEFQTGSVDQRGVDQW